MPPGMSGGSSRGRDGGDGKKEAENEGPVHSVSHQHYSLPAVRYSNIMSTVVIINGLLSVILWLCGECLGVGVSKSAVWLITKALAGNWKVEEN